MTRLLAIAFVVLVAAAPGCDEPEETPDTVDVFHDSRRMVTCWSRGRDGIACLPDWMLTDPIDLPNLGTEPKVKRKPQPKKEINL